MSTPSSPSEPEMPTGRPGLERTGSFIQSTPRRAIASFDNLVALANHQERLREARKMVWRDRGEPEVELNEIWECLEHAARGGSRAASLAFAIRASVNLVLALIKLKRTPRKLRLSLIYYAVFGRDSLRFAAMLGSFVSIYKFLLNALPIVMPTPMPPRRLAREADTSIVNTPIDDEADLEIGRGSRIPLSARRARLSVSAHTKVMIRKQTRRWHAVFAGAVAGGAAIMFESKSRRTLIAQQMFVRGLQGSYNAFSTKHGIHVPYGAVLVFSLGCGQIMYSFFLRPDTLDRSYNHWIQLASKAPKQAVSVNMGLVRDGKFNPKDLEPVIAMPDIHPRNRTDLLSRLAAAEASIPDFGPRHGPCSITHPWYYNCWMAPLDKFFMVGRWMLPIYGALHLIPVALFKRKEFLQNPMRIILRAGWGASRSSAFLGAFVFIYQLYWCLKHNFHDYLMSGQSPLPPQVSRLLANLMVSKASFWLGGFLSGLSLFVEERRRRGELAMYVLPKSLESLWIALRGKGLVFHTGDFGEMILSAIAMSMVMNTYQNDPQHLSGLVRRILYQFIGPN